MTANIFKGMGLKSWSTKHYLIGSFYLQTFYTINSYEVEDPATQAHAHTRTHRLTDVHSK